ncbi:MAG TPA: DUF190 domain-containing protein [Chromatiales bacterium]|nr:DUF190 domain-containing protein [Chromatiales bacterium]
MKFDDGMMLRVFVGEADQYDGQPLYQWIVEQAHRRKLAGASVLRGLEGFGAGSRIHTARVLRLSTDLPMVVEIVDDPASIEAFVEFLDAEIPDHLLTLEKVRIRPGRRAREARSD